VICDKILDKLGAKQMINHVVLAKFKIGVSEADIEELERMLDDLPNKITEIHSYEFGRDLAHSATSYDFSIIGLFANLVTLDRYRTHPRHTPVAKKMEEICESVVTVDFEGSDAGSIEIERPSWDFKP
jgi:hypothetical protein